MPQISRSAGTGVCLLLILCSPALAVGEEPWAEGKQAYADGNFELALERFETARDTGLDGPAVHYNIAVCQFELGLFAAADTTFKLIGERFPQMRALAEYNRGLVAVEQGRHSDSRERFLAAYRLATEDDTLRALASTMLNRTDVPADSGDAVSGAWGVSAGYDDNIALRDDTGLPTGITTESSLVDAWAYVYAPITALRGLHIDGSAYAVVYPDADDFDQTAIDAGIGYRWGSERWQLRAGFNAGLSTFGGDSFDSTRSGRVSWRYAASQAGTLELAAAFSDISAGDAAFAGIAGTRRTIAGRYRWQRDAHTFDIALELEDNSRADPGISASRERLRFRYRFAPGPRWNLRIGAEFRRSDYDELALPRTEDRRTVTLGFGRHIGSLWEVFTQARIADNESSDALYSYDRSNIAIGVQRIF